MVPFATLLIPLYVLLNGLGLQNSLIGVALGAGDVPAAVCHLHDAHLIRGGAARARGIRADRRLRHLRRAVADHASLGRPGLVTVGLFAFLAAWNDFFAPLIMLTDRAKQTLPLAVANLRQQTMGAIDYGATEAGVVVMALPCVILFLLLQRYYVRGFMSGAVKG